MRRGLNDLVDIQGNVSTRWDSVWCENGLIFEVLFTTSGAAYRIVENGKYLESCAYAAKRLSVAFDQILYVSDRLPTVKDVHFGTPAHPEDKVRKYVKGENPLLLLGELMDKYRSILDRQDGHHEI